MYYALIGLLALLILLIMNYDMLLRSPDPSVSPARKTYRLFLFSVIAYYVTDIFWGLLDGLRLTSLLYADTVIYFLAMASGILFWTRYVTSYLEERNRYRAVLSVGGWVFFCAFAALILVNFLIPVVFWYDAYGAYHTGPARHIMLLVQIIMFLLTSAYALGVTAQTKDLVKNRHLAIGLSGMSMVISLSIQLFFPLLPLCSIGYMLGTCLLRTFVIESEKEEYRRELEESLRREQQQREELSATWQLAYTDQLTGVRSKLAYADREKQFNRTVEDGSVRSTALVVFDLNDLKYVNDSLGHEAGDRYIRDACKMICDTFAHSPVFRVGGDEFVAFLEGQDFENRDRLFSDFNRRSEENRAAGGAVVAAGMSDFIPGFDTELEQVFRRADRKMYTRKKELKQG